MSTGNGLAWIGALLIGAVVLTPNLTAGGEAPEPSAAASGKRPKPSASHRAAPATLNRELIRAADGHFYADAQVNGAPVRFMVDTGASMVALSQADAQRAGIPLGPERDIAVGVGGEVEIVPVSIDRIALGPVDARNVRGAVVKELDVSLLGQSFLSQIGRVEIRGDRMILH